MRPPASRPGVPKPRMGTQQPVEPRRMEQMIRLIGIDVDGTLLDGAGLIPPANLRAIEAAVSAGLHVALVTGRSYPSVRPVADPLPASVSLIVSNGAVERTMDGATRVRRLLDRHVARQVLDATRAHRDHAVLVFDRDAARQIVFETMDWTDPARERYWARHRSRIERTAPLETALTEDPIQVMFNGPVAAMRRIAAVLGDGPPGVAVALTEYDARDFALVDVTAPGATKGRALAACAARLGVPPDEVMAIGDNLNDLDMLEYAGRPVVMGNAVPALKSRGWHVTGHQNEAGLAAAIEYFALRRE
jgi:Cof subfamily protein (haloacid dehalogenase superfamily)